MDAGTAHRIACLAVDAPGDRVVEIGAGTGTLTAALIALGADLTAFDIDPDLVEVLRSRDDLGGAVIERADALTFDFADWAGERPWRAAGNLPYNIATPLLIGWLRTEPWPPWFQSLTLMFQREVAERIVAPPGSRTYGRLSVLAGWRTEAEILFDVPARAFTPPPKITSSVVQFIPRPRPLACDPAVLERVVAAAFGQRRKMLRQSLKALGLDALALLAAASITETRRAEEIDVAGFVALANAAEALDVRLAGGLDQQPVDEI
jgi:16S rRNA (adenine1518-N6/adenine1519-N6)-dimethyltransferase